VQDIPQLLSALAYEAAIGGATLGSGRISGDREEANAFEAIFLLEPSASARWLVSKLVSQEELI